MLAPSPCVQYQLGVWCVWGLLEEVPVQLLVLVSVSVLSFVLVFVISIRISTKTNIKTSIDTSVENNHHWYQYCL